MCKAKILLFSLYILFFILATCSAVDRITETQTIMDGETIVSSNGTFAMGFFSPGKSKNRYLGIWYNKVNVITPVWVANRETPLNDSSGILKVKKPGILVILNSTNEIIWSSNTSISVKHPVAQLLDSGNIVVRNASDESLENIIWQSFDYPVDTHLDGLKLGKNFLTGKEWYLTSWKSEDDPSPGDYTLGIDTRGYPQLFLWTRSIETCRLGVWIGDRFSGFSLATNSIYHYIFVFSKDEVNFTFGLSSIQQRRVVNHTGVMQWWLWAERQATWELYAMGSPRDLCDSYKMCGAYGSCNIYKSPICTCLDKFVAKSPEGYNAGYWSTGCVRRTPLNCQKEKGDIFLKYSGLKLPDTRKSWFDSTVTLENCREMCLGNCSCTAYSSMDFTRVSGCFQWFGDLIDMRSLSDGQDIYIRMASSEAKTEVEQNETTEAVPKVASDHKSPKKIIIGLTLAIGGLLLFLGLSLYVWKRKRTHMSREGTNRNIFSNNSARENQSKDLSLPMFELETIREATNNFSMSNKLGQGGYGPVYKGVLEGGKEVAVKRLSSCSAQGLNEFKNEVLCIAKLQHRNLVKLLGCCVEGEEKMLIYEYMPNKSLDNFIFDETQSKLLNWPKRFNIINGISRGILYLHQDSRLRIIHRYLKAGNILLDTDMNPKIADFGMARIFGGNETEANTHRVVGTYGYMSPEYQVDGTISARSDVFSFGVLVLEIVSGKKNRGFFHPDHNHNLLGHAWLLYNEGKPLKLIDAAIMDSCSTFEVMRSIHVALLCVQQYPEDRPSMSYVVLMLSSDMELPQPKQPGFFTERKPLEVEYSTSREACSSNGVTITLLHAR